MADILFELPADEEKLKSRLLPRRKLLDRSLLTDISALFAHVEASGDSASQLRSAGSPPSRISKLPSGATSNWVSLITPAVLYEKPPSLAPASRVIET